MLNTSQQADWLDRPVQSLSPGFPQRLALVDLETTGGSSAYHKIIEIGVILVDEGQITQRWQSFIDPGVSIPEKINQLTGISDKDVISAPVFADIAGELEQLLAERIIVAHNAKFDVGFLKAAFNTCEISFKPKTLCSVRLSRKLFPQFKRHSLNHIIRRFNCYIHSRHRALDDAEVIWQFFLNISRIHSEEDISIACDTLVKQPNVPPLLGKEVVDGLPKKSGVYYFYNSDWKLLYIGKSVNIHDRVRSHFSQPYTRNRQVRMYSSIAHIDYEITPSDFGAQIRESQQIKKLKPEFNLRLRKSRYLYYLSTSLSDEGNHAGYLQVSIDRVDSAVADSQQHFGLFRSFKQAEKQLEKLADQYFLCYKLLGLEKSRQKHGPCFRHQLKKCFGACCGEEAPELYNERLQAAIKNYQIMQWPWPSAILVKECCPGDGELVNYHLLDQWRYLASIKIEEELLDHGYVMQEKFMYETDMQSKTNQDGANQEMGDIVFDLDIYFVLARFLMNPELMRIQGLSIYPLTKHMNY